MEKILVWVLVQKQKETGILFRQSSADSHAFSSNFCSLEHKRHVISVILQPQRTCFPRLPRNLRQPDYRRVLWPTLISRMRALSHSGICKRDSQFVCWAWTLFRTCSQLYRCLFVVLITLLVPRTILPGVPHEPLTWDFTTCVFSFSWAMFAPF